MLINIYIQVILDYGNVHYNSTKCSIIISGYELYNNVRVHNAFQTGDTWLLKVAQFDPEFFTWQLNPPPFTLLQPVNFKLLASGMHLSCLHSELDVLPR